MSDTIKSIIQINGGKAGSVGSLYSRELFLDSNGYLYYGPMSSDGSDLSTPQGGMSLKAKTADVSAKLHSNVNSGSTNAIDISGLTYNSEDKQLMLSGATIRFSSGGSISGTNISGFTTLECATNIETKNIEAENATIDKLTKVIVGEGNFGDVNPIEGNLRGTKGQLYFQII